MHNETGSLWEHSYLRGDISLNIVNLHWDVMKEPLCISYAMNSMCLICPYVFLQKNMEISATLGAQLTAKGAPSVIAVRKVIYRHHPKFGRIL